MNICKKLLCAVSFLAAASAFADDTDVNVHSDDASRDPAMQRSETEEVGTDEGYKVGITNFAVRPSAGAIFFNGNERFAGGLLMDFNVMSTPWAKIGPATGVIYSSLSGGDFFSGVGTGNDNYILQIPANVKATFSPDPAGRLHLGVHGGANIIRSSAAAGAFGVDTPTAGSSWDVHPNVGGDIDFALGTNVDLSLRPDVSFLSAFDVVTTTLGLALKL